MDLFAEMAKYGPVALILFVGLGAIWKAYQSTLERLFNMTMTFNETIKLNATALDNNTRVVQEVSNKLDRFQK